MESVTELIKIINNPNQDTAAKVRLLKLHRCTLLEEIHKKQQLLDQIDYLISKIMKENHFNEYRR